MDLALTGSNDLELTEGRLRLISGVEATAQRLRIKFQTWLGEWYLDRRVGVPYVRDILVKNPNVRVITAIFREIALADPGVTEVTSIDVTFNAADRSMALVVACVGIENEPFEVAFSSYVLRSER